jgi:DNA polymerase elongation subunit (family B)
MQRNFTLVLKPREMSVETAQNIVDKFEDTVLCSNEYELIDVFLSLIEDVDVLSGWNSEGYDIPYIHNRIIQVLGKEHTRRLCLWNKFPKKKEYLSFGKDAVTYELFGRVHLDYLQLYRKHTYHEMHSYRLDYVGEYEVGEKKVEYQGTLDSLYNNDFEKFIAYNRQDVALLAKIDAKLRFIDLSNDLAHTNGVLLATTMGSVMLIDNAITNEAHDLGMMVPAKFREREEETVESEDDEDDTPHGIVGAYVADPVQGIHQWIGGVDINSLYPSTIRALNMSRETVIGQIRPTHTDKLISKRIREEKKSHTDAWNDTFGTLEYNMVMNQDLTMVVVDFEDGTTVELTGAELYEWIFSNPKPMSLSANGTIFDLSREGVIPGLLSRWYSQRKEMQSKVKNMSKLGAGLKLSPQLFAQVSAILKERGK